jgi:hypothetical protein
MPGRAATVHHGLMAAAMTWMIAEMPMGATAAITGGCFLLAAVPWIYYVGRRKSTDALCHAAMSLATGLMVLVAMNTKPTAVFARAGSRCWLPVRRSMTSSPTITAAFTPIRLATRSACPSKTCRDRPEETTERRYQ